MPPIPEQRQILVLGCGRSGTSLTAGLLNLAGYHAGPSVIYSNPSNPKGFFESPEIHSVNELLIEGMPHTPAAEKKWVLPWKTRKPPAQKNHWLTRVPMTGPEPEAGRLRERLADLCNHEPFCFKDPRFCYTLPAWRPFLVDPLFVCVFRSPADTALSVQRHLQKSPVSWNVKWSFQEGLRLWLSMYTHILERHVHSGNWLFLHYEQLLNEDGLTRLASACGVDLDSSFVDRTLHRSRSRRRLPSDVQCRYQELCDRAKFTPSAE